MNDKLLTDPRLHCLLDNEATTLERAEILAAMAKDPELKATSCELSRQKELVQIAYAEVRAPAYRRSSVARPLAIAASLILAVGAAFTAYLHSSANNPATRAADPGIDQSRMVLLDPDGSGKQLAQPGREETRIVFQITDPNKQTTSDVIEEIEGVLVEYRRQQRAIRVELVAHGDGLNLLRKGLSEHAGAIDRLGNEFPNLTFIACQNTAERIANNQGFPVELLPKVVTIRSGVGHVAKRQAEGWVYIHI